MPITLCGTYLLLALLIFSCGHHTPIPEEDSVSVEVEVKKEYLETIFSSQQNACHVSITTHLAESINKDVARIHHQHCTDDLLTAKLLEKILSKISSLNKGALPFTSLSMGRLEEYPAFSQALTTFASHSQLWNTKKGRPSTGDPNKFTTQALNQLLPSQWIVQVLQPYWRVIKIPSVEKVLIDPVTKLPFDCQFWLSSK